jgi:hypothetical protein
MKFFFERRYKFREAGTQTRDTDGLNLFVPGVLKIGGNRKYLFEEYLRRKTGTLSGEIGATISAKHALVEDGCRERGS